MRNWLLLLISVAALAHAEPPPRLEITFAMTRNDANLAEVSEHGSRSRSMAWEVRLGGSSSYQAQGLDDVKGATWDEWAP